MPVQDYNVDPDLNTTISGINIAEGCAPSGINDAIRQLMADVKEESEAQAEAVAGAESSASEQLTALDSTLRELIAQEVAKYLPRSGGAMAGTVVTHTVAALLRSATNSGLYISGGPSVDEGAFVQLFGIDAGGMAELVTVAADGTHKAFQLWPDGRIFWDNKYVITSAGGGLTGPLESSANNALNVVRTSGESIAVRAEHTPTGNALRFGIGATGNRGIYDEKTSKWIINFTPNGELVSDGRGVDLIVASGVGYLRYESGVQICWLTTTTWDSGGLIWTFPAAFASAPTIIATPRSAEACDVHTASYEDATATSVTLWHLRSTTNGGVANAEVSALAIGRWK